MRYAEDRKLSAEILRLALAHIGRQKAGFNPMSFTLWYEHCAGLNPGLSRVLKARINANSPLTEEDVLELYSEHIMGREIRRGERWRSEFYQLLTDTADNTEEVGEEILAVGRSLEDHDSQLAFFEGSDAVRATVADVRDETGKMLAHLFHKVASSELMVKVSLGRSRFRSALPKRLQESHLRNFWSVRMRPCTVRNTQGVTALKHEDYSRKKSVKLCRSIDSRRRYCA